MFSNPGYKLQSLSKVLTVIGMICSVIPAIVLCLDNFLTGLPGGVLLCFAFRAAGLSLSAFGELVENSSVTAETLLRMEKVQSKNN